MGKSIEHVSSIREMIGAGARKGAGAVLAGALAFTGVGAALPAGAPLQVREAQAAGYATIEDGYYVLESAVGNGVVLDIYGGERVNGANAQVYKANGTVAQVFHVSSVGGKEYKIAYLGFQGERKVLDVASGSKKSGTNVQIYDWNGTAAQRWCFEDAGGGYYTIESKLGTRLDVAGASSKNGTNVIAYAANGTKAQKWKLKKVKVTALKGIKAKALGSTSLAMDGAKTVKLTVSGGYSPSNATGANGKSRVEWTTSNANVATVDRTGETVTVHAKGAGTATITAWGYNSVNSSVTVKVSAPRKSAYDQKVDAFLADARWRNGAAWGGGQRPKVASYTAYGCCAYACDFAKYVFGANSYRSGQAFYSPSAIRAGDIVKVTGSQHWFVVLSRSGNSLRTAEGNWTGGRVVVSNGTYTVSGNTLCRNGKRFRTFSVGYHMK